MTQTASSHVVLLPQLVLLTNCLLIYHRGLFLRDRFRWLFVDPRTELPLLRLQLLCADRDVVLSGERILLADHFLVGQLLSKRHRARWQCRRQLLHLA